MTQGRRRIEDLMDRMDRMDRTDRTDRTERSDRWDRCTNRAVIARGGLVALIVVALLAGVLLLPAGASIANKSKKTWSAADCATLQGITVDPSKGAGSFGAAAKATSKAYNEAANEIQEKQLKKALKTLASFYVDLGDAKSAAAAAVLTTKGGKAYGNALKVFLKASVYCVTQITIPTATIPSVTTPTTSSSSTTSTSSASSSTSTSTSAPTSTSTSAPR
jgi:TolA-binding protein